MRLIKAAHMGMCFGVRDAIAAARQVETPTTITIHGQLVHNPVVNRELAARGFLMQSERDRDMAPPTERVLITAHGVSNAHRARLMAAGKTLIDTTCPLVRRAHAAALGLADAGYHVLIIGKRNHVEVLGLAGDLPAHDIIESEADVRDFHQQRLGIIQQTTTVREEAERLHALIRAANPQADVRFINTICQPTRDRQEALEELLAKVDVMVVVGGRESNNTRQLKARCEQGGVRAVHIEGPDELSVTQFAGHETIGLTAGTSTLPETIAAVEEKLEQILAQHARLPRLPSRPHKRVA